MEGDCQINCQSIAFTEEKSFCGEMKTEQFNGEQWLHRSVQREKGQRNYWDSSLHNSQNCRQIEDLITTKIGVVASLQMYTEINGTVLKQ